MINPYDSSRASLASGDGHATTTHRAWRYRITLVLLLFALMIGTRTVVKQYFVQKQLEQEGVSARSSSMLDVMALPGVFLLYVVGTVTNSWACAWAAFAVGLALTYGLLGFVLDACWQRAISR